MVDYNKYSDTFHPNPYTILVSTLITLKHIRSPASKYQNILNKNTRPYPIK